MSYSNIFRQNNWIEKTVLNKGFWVVFLLLVFTYPIYRSVNRQLPPELPRYYRVPDFNLVNEHSEPFSNKNLDGKVYIASFFFTRCPSVCPKILKALQLVQHRTRGVRDRFGILSFTVDPEFDRPNILLNSANELKANPVTWRFLTGDKIAVEDLLTKGFRVPMAGGETNDGLSLAHSEKFVLVDQEGFVRGYYSADKVGIDKLMIDVGLLINRIN